MPRGRPPGSKNRSQATEQLTVPIVQEPPAENQRYLQLMFTSFSNQEPPLLDTAWGHTVMSPVLRGELIKAITERIGGSEWRYRSEISGYFRFFRKNKFC